LETCVNFRFCIFALLLLAACHTRQSRTVAFDSARIAHGTVQERVPGCYDLRDGAWQTDKQLAVFYAPQYLPRRFQFDTTKLQGWDPLQDATSPMWSLRARPVSASGYSPFTYWKRLRPTADTIYVGAPLPLGGASMILWPVVDGFAGTLTTFTDAIPQHGPSSASVSIRLHRSECVE
jgi:hypothetical protein